LEAPIATNVCLEQLFVSTNQTKAKRIHSFDSKFSVFKTPYQVFFERTGIDARQLGVVRL
jgi:hypothetical protein